MQRAGRKPSHSANHSKTHAQHKRPSEAMTAMNLYSFAIRKLLMCSQGCVIFRKLSPFKWGGMLPSAAASWRRAEGQDFKCAGQDRPLCMECLALTQLSCGIRARDVVKNPHSDCGEWTTNIERLPFVRQDPECSQARNRQSIWFYLQQCRSGSEQVACMFMVKNENQDSWRLWNLESKMNILSNLTCKFSISLIMNIYKK